MNKDVKPKRAEELASEFDGKSDPSILYPEKGTLTAIACTATSNVTVELYDGPVMIAKIDKKALFQATEDLKKPYKDKGIDWQTVDHTMGIECFHNIEHNLKIKGDLKNLIFWINGKAISG